MKAGVLAAVLILAACGTASAPLQTSATPSSVADASPTPPPTPTVGTPPASPAATASPNATAANWVVTTVRGSDCGAAVSGWSPCFTSVSCPTNNLCVTVGAAGTVIASSNPTGGKSAWTGARIDGTNLITGVSCPSSAFCVAVDQVGNVVTSSNPTAGSAAWTVTHVDGSNCAVSSSKPAACFLTGVSCPTVDLCVAVDGNGNVVTSNKPTGAATDWIVSHVDANFLSAVSCPSSSRCVALDIVGNVVTSTNPTGGSGAWSVAHVDGSSCVVTETGAPCYLSSVSCPGVDLCVAVDESGNVVTSTKPTGGAAAWKVTNLNNGGLYDPYSLHSGVSCPTNRFCVGVGNDSEARGFEISSTDPTGGSNAWTRTIHIGGSILNSVYCPSSNLCVAVSYWGDVVTSTTPSVPPTP